LAKDKFVIAVAIPTFNRVEKLKNAIFAIEQQDFDTQRVELLCCISNSASFDGTTEYIDSLQDGKIKFVVNNSVVFAPEVANKESGYHNWNTLTSIVPAHVDWVWFMGDDDYLMSKSAIRGLASILEQTDDPSLKIIHVSQARRSRGSGKVVRGKLLELCNRLGFHEMLGWMSSLVIRTDVFKRFMPLVKEHYPETAYGHSAAFLELCTEHDALFVDAKWVDTQDDRQTDDAIKRWAEVNTGERYFYVVDGVLSQVERGIIQRKLKPVFYRYHTYSLWDRYAAFLIGRAVNSGELPDVDIGHWERVRKIADTLDDPVFAKLYLAWHGSISKQIRDILRMQKVLVEAKRGLVDYHNQINLGCYPAQELLEGL
jgi:glycosyltransferase involved in cell wall biosynthesis